MLKPCLFHVRLSARVPGALTSLALLALLAAFPACATAGGGDGGQNGDGGPGNIDAIDPGPSCGNNTVDPGEACDGFDLNNEDCVSRGYEGGTLACDVNSCAFDTSGCYRCGDGQINGSESCDGVELNGETCQSLGYIGGDLACDAATCGFNINGCVTGETLQNDNGNCPSEIGCSTNDGTGTSGNPQSLVECFRNASLAPPFYVTEISYTLSSSDAAPDELFIEVYEWSGTGAPTENPTTEPMPAAGLPAGPHTIALANPVLIDNATGYFCVGLAGVQANDGFRILFSDSSTVFGATYIEATTCGANVLTSVSEVVGPGNWCMSATIDKVQP